MVKVSNNVSNVDIHLTLYQKHMKNLITFMNEEKIDKDIQKKAIDYFEYDWQRTHCIRAKNLLEKCFGEQSALWEDLAISLYENTFLEVPAFNNISPSFFRVLGMKVVEKYFLRGTTVIRLNDIVFNIYIIHRGEVTVLGPDGSIFAMLVRGCIFGNIDNCECTRSMTTMVASKQVDLLQIDTVTFYDITKDYPAISSRLQRQLIIENLSYFPKKDHQKSEEIVYLKEEISSPGLKSEYLQLPIMLLSFFSCMSVSYHLAFQKHMLIMFVLTYVPDILLLQKFYFGFFSPYKNDIGEIITNRKKIRRRYMTFSQLYLDILDSFPFEIFSLIAPSSQRLYYLTWLRVNRLFRIYNILSFFDMKYERLNINVMMVKLCSTCIWTTLAVHLLTCILYIISCPKATCTPSHWIYNINQTMPSVDYVRSLFLVVNIITCAGLWYEIPHTRAEVIYGILLIVLSKIFIAVYLGDMSSVVQNYSYLLLNYDHNLQILKEYLKNTFVSVGLQDLVITYAKQLWQYQGGRQFPALLVEGPQFIMEDLKNAAYGKYLYNNVVFHYCHVDFLRQLAGKIQKVTFFANDVIVQNGDVNNTMYFIHKGKVQVLSSADNETVMEVLDEKDCFGIIQGLFDATPHENTYRAVVVTVLLTLKLNDWSYLLKFYPASKFDIYDKVNSL